MSPLDLLPFIVFAKADAIAGAVGGLTRSLAAKEILVRVVISAVIGGAVAYYLAPIVTILLVMYSRDNPEFAEFLISNARNPIGFVVGFASIYLTQVLDTAIKGFAKFLDKSIEKGK